ncbi:YceI family protein [Rhizosphaericola mali]|uniref:Polyisoprenoid-binding protein n=1 Tax=Rhizosphaericola mali TaxID=2545455 RepID=A0A5P2G641_9BACT|nr:YceI family protein [Rhizosphaericola mali]QES90128.1 polyisoprenoid-binding protein [Rhizosphaericola mali]
MKQGFLFLIVGALSYISVSAQTKWSADPMHTDAAFSVKHLGLSFVDGDFTKASGTMESKSATDFNDAKIDYIIETASIDTRVEARNNHLKTDDFFNVAKYPEMKLVSVSFKKIKGNTYKMVANLTIRDITKPVVFTVTQNGGPITDPWGKTRIGFTATTTIDRHQFGMKYNDKLPSGVEAVASMVSIVVNTELVKD